MMMMMMITGVLFSREDSSQSYYNSKFTVRRTPFSKMLEPEATL